MKTSTNGINLIKHFEGCRLTSYKCPAGVWTIGTGHTGGIKQGQTITQTQADELLANDLKVFENAVNSLVKVPINQAQFDSLVSFTFNCGPDALKGSTLLKLLNAKNYIEAGQEFKKWNKAGKTELLGLTKRRKAEEVLFLTGKLSLI
ncbi:MAG: lysozyme [bacterium]